MTHELYKRYRPKKFKDIVGQEATVKTLKAKCENGTLPHALLFIGPSGCGKTTIARIIATKLGCDPEDPNQIDFYEINASDRNGIDDIREIGRLMRLRPSRAGSARVWIIDEAHQLTTPAQNTFLKILEDTPKHVYFMLATTDPGKLLKTVRTRCAEFQIQLISDDKMAKLVEKVCEAEKLDITEDVRDKIVSVAEGSARKALVLLDSIKELDSEEEMLTAIRRGQNEEVAFRIAQVLCKPNSTWKELQKVITGVKEIDSDPEGLRWMVLGYAKKLLLTNNAALQKKAFKVITIFRDNLYDCKGAGFIANCYEVYHS